MNYCVASHLHRESQDIFLSDFTLQNQCEAPGQIVSLYKYRNYVTDHNISLLALSAEKFTVKPKIFNSKSDGFVICIALLN
jgi:hypothetical protein